MNNKFRLTSVSVLIWKTLDCNHIWKILGPKTSNRTKEFKPLNFQIGIISGIYKLPFWQRVLHHNKQINIEISLYTYLYTIYFMPITGHIKKYYFI